MSDNERAKADRIRTLTKDIRSGVTKPSFFAKMISFKFMRNEIYPNSQTYNPQIYNSQISIHPDHWMYETVHALFHLDAFQTQMYYSSLDETEVGYNAKDAMINQAVAKLQEIIDRQGIKRTVVAVSYQFEPKIGFTAAPDDGIRILATIDVSIK